MNYCDTFALNPYCVTYHNILNTRVPDVTIIIAIFNQAGGVMKTSLAINLGYQLHLKKHKTLLVDMNPQGSFTTFMGLEPHELGESRKSTTSRHATSEIIAVQC